MRGIFSERWVSFCPQLRPYSLTPNMSKPYLSEPKPSRVGSDEGVISKRLTQGGCGAHKCYKPHFSSRQNRALTGLLLGDRKHHHQQGKAYAWHMHAVATEACQRVLGEALAFEQLVHSDLKEHKSTCEQLETLIRKRC